MPSRGVNVSASRTLVELAAFFPLLYAVLGILSSTGVCHLRIRNEPTWSDSVDKTPSVHFVRGDEQLGGWRWDLYHPA